MNPLITIAWRNITRNRRRSVITCGAVGFGLGALIFILSFVEGAHRQMIENYTSLTTGHVQIHRTGFQQKNKLELNIPEAEKLLAMIKHSPDVVAATTRIKAVGLVSSAESSGGVMIVGVHPEEEKSVSTLHKRIRQGAFLSGESDEELVMGETLAKNLNVTIGDKLVLMSQALDGSIAAGAYRLKGVFDTGAEELDKGLVLITHKAAEEIFVMPAITSEIAVRTPSAQTTAAISKRIAKNLHDPSLEVLAWQTISPSFQQWIEFDNGFIWLIVVIVMIVVAIGILNTILMGVLERTREFGILLALGTRRGEITAIIGWESVFLGLIGSAWGLILGLTLTLIFSRVGIDLSFFTSALNSFYIDAVIYPQINTPATAICGGLVLLTSIAASIYPAWHAARLKPIEAIRSL